MMFNAEDFELPLQKKLRLRMIKDEVTECNDIDLLKQNLIDCCDSLLRHQHLLTVTLEKQLHHMNEMLPDEVVKLIEEG